VARYVAIALGVLNRAHVVLARYTNADSVNSSGFARRGTRYTVVLIGDTPADDDASDDPDVSLGMESPPSLPVVELAGADWRAPGNLPARFRLQLLLRTA
jgi:hypothetical protein